jgi:hypothetical protein
VQLRLVDEQMNDVEHDGEQVGEIVVRAPWLTQGYLKDQRNSENLWKGGYLHTGDVANINHENYVTITDRIKDVIKTGGEWLSSLELEDVIGLHPAVSEVAVIGMVDKKWGERPLALVVPKKKQPLPRPGKWSAHINQFIDKGLLSKQAMLLKVKVVEAIDKTSVGKTDKKNLRSNICLEQTSVGKLNMAGNRSERRRAGGGSLPFSCPTGNGTDQERKMAKEPCGLRGKMRAISSLALLAEGNAAGSDNRPQGRRRWPYGGRVWIRLSVSGPPRVKW